MTYLNELPPAVARLIATRFICEFATLAKDGTPIDTPLVPFASADGATIDSATGLAYPAKAERVRRNPKVGLLFSGGVDEPVVSIAAMAAVRDRDFQANLERYLSEQILTTMLDPASTDYEGVTRHAIWYFTRILLVARPAVVRWWDNPGATDSAPHEWRAADGTVWPQSDPPPEGAATPSPWKPQGSWRALAEQALVRGAIAHLTLTDAEGFPLPIRARAVHADAEGFRLDLPGWLPWREGRASVTFDGIETFVGTAEAHAGIALFRAERALPLHPLMTDPAQILAPLPETRAALLGRIDRELARRGLPRPVMPDHAPQPTPGARLRAENAFAFGGFAAQDG